MKISIVILNWNRPADTESAVESVLRQVDTNFEVLVWDNASSDDSRDRLTRRFESEPRVRLVFADANYGVAGGRNRSFREATGDVLFSLDSDALLRDPDALGTLRRFLEEHPDVGAASFEVVRPDGHLMWPFTRPAAACRKQVFETIRVDGCAFAVHRHVWQQAGGFAEHFSPYGAEDQHFAYRVQGIGYPVMYLPTITVEHAFAPHGRTPLQFQKHIRNSLWIPLELFPLPWALASAARAAFFLAQDAREQGAWGSYLRGLVETLFGFRPRRRQPIPLTRWRHIRGLIREDKALATPS